MTKTTPQFINYLALISIVGFAAIAAESYFGVDWGDIVPSIILVLAGIGLAVEGQIRMFFRKKTYRNGLSSNEISHLTASIVGVAAIITGILSAPALDITNPALEGTKGIVALIAMAIIAIETWVVK